MFHRCRLKNTSEEPSATSSETNESIPGARLHGASQGSSLTSHACHVTSRHSSRSRPQPSPGFLQRMTQQPKVGADRAQACRVNLQMDTNLDERLNGCAGAAAAAVWCSQHNFICAWLTCMSRSKLLSGICATYKICQVWASYGYSFRHCHRKKPPATSKYYNHWYARQLDQTQTQIP
jgi:hypothetical protein